MLDMTRVFHASHDDLAANKDAIDNGLQSPARHGQNERAIALGRKNHLFAGSDGGAKRWATVCSLITTAKLNDVEPFAYLQNVIERMSSGHPMSKLDDLLPWKWQPTTALN